MTLHVFPTAASTPGLEWNVKKGLINSTRILTARSGKEYRSPNWSYPKYRWTLSYSVLRDGRNGLTELDDVLGFCLARQGQYEDFLYEDPSDKTATAQVLGTGTGALTDFSLCRTKGVWTDPNLVAHVVSAVYVAGTPVALTTDYTIEQVGNFGLDTIRFNSPVAFGDIVTADFTYYFPVRFMQDDPEFENIFYQMWAMKKLQFQSVK